MLTNRTFIIVVLILLSGIATNWIIQDAETEPPPDRIAKNDPDLYMVNPRITQFDASGLPKHRIDAERMTHFPLTDVTTLRGPRILLYQESGTTPWDIVAKNGRLLPSGPLRNEIVELWEEVLAYRQKQDGGYINIQTESLTVFPDKDFVQTEKAVAIDNQRGRTTAGGGMKGDLNAGLFEFYGSTVGRVKTVLAPIPRKDHAG